MHPLSSLTILLIVAVCSRARRLPRHHNNHTPDRIILERTDDDITLTCDIKGAKGNIQWYTNVDAHGGRGGRRTETGRELTILMDDLDYYYVYKYTCCHGNKCASHLVSYDPPCEDPIENQWPAVTHTDPLQLLCGDDFAESSIFRNGIEEWGSMTQSLLDYGRFSCRVFTSSEDYGSYCYKETSTQYLPQDCGRLQGNDPSIFTVQLKQRRTGENYCSGVLVSDQYVLTAAHCVNGPKARGKHVDKSHYFNIRVVAGAGNHEQVLSINEEWDIRVHHKHRGHNQHDIALLKLSAPVTFNTHVQPACLAWDNLFSFDTHHRNGALVTPREGKKPLIVKNSCAGCDTDDTTLCASAPAGAISHITTCQGDSGSPMLMQYPENGQYFAVGVVSSGIGYCSTCTRFMRVDSYYTWIADRVEERW